MSVVPPQASLTVPDNRTVHIAEPNEVPAIPPSPDIPHTYGENRLLFLVRDPTTLFATWEVTGQAYEEALKRAGPVDWAHLALRIFELVPGAAELVMELDVSGTSSWYIYHDRSGSWCQAQIGVRTSGGFYPIVQSRPVQVPPGGESDLVDAEWTTIDEVLERSRQGQYRGGGSVFI